MLTISPRRAALALTVVALAVSQPVAAYDRLPSQLARLSPADFAARVHVADDPLEPAIVFSTQAGYPRGRSIDGARAGDVHMRALLDRHTGRVTWQVWHELIYAHSRRDLTGVHYQAGGTLRRAEPIMVGHWLDQCPPTDAVGFCNQFTRIGFELPEQTVREIAAVHRQGSSKPWRLRFKDAKGRDVTGGLAPAEAAGLVQALDAWRAGAAR